MDNGIHSLENFKWNHKRKEKSNANYFVALKSVECSCFLLILDYNQFKYKTKARQLLALWLQSVNVTLFNNVKNNNDIILK